MCRNTDVILRVRSFVIFDKPVAKKSGEIYTFPKFEGEMLKEKERVVVSSPGGLSRPCEEGESLT